MITVLGRQYHFQKRRWAIIIGLIDALGTFLFSLLGRNIEPMNVRKILVSRIDHLGDVLLATCALPHLKRAYPDAKIDFLIGEWAKDLLVNNPYVNETITYNSFLHNRSGSLWHRIRSDAISFLNAFKKIRKERYDLSIDLRAYFINSIPLLYLSGVEYIVGYGTGGFGFLLDKEVLYRTGIHEVLHIADLIKSIGVDVKDEEIRPLYKISILGEERAKSLLKSEHIQSGESFILIHPGTSDKKKEWNIQGWKTIINDLKQSGVKIVLCGGSNDIHIVKAILSEGSQNGIVNITSPLPLEVFAGVVKRASLVIGLDSFPCHLAAALGTPTVVLWSGINDPVQWRPYGNNVEIVRKDLSCAPCYRSKGCEQIICMDINPEEVLEKARLQLRNKTRSLY